MMQTEKPTAFMRLFKYLYRRMPILSGLTKLSFNKLVNAAFGRRERVLLATMWDGTTIEVDSNDYHGRILYLFGTNDPKVSLTTNALLRRGDVFLDIGANYSTIGLNASHHVGAGGVVHLFEPQSKIANRVRTAISANDRRNVVLHQVGLLDNNGSFTIRGPKNHSGMATFVDHEDSAPFEAIETCEVRAISEYASALVNGRAFGAKIDIEGSEPLIMPWIVSQPGMRFLVFEGAHHHRFLYDTVLEEGLELFGLTRNPFRLRVTHVQDFNEMSRFHDFVAIRGATAGEIRKVMRPAELAKILK